MGDEGAVEQELAAEEALRLIATVAIGRLVFTWEALPAVRPVGFVLDGGDIVLAVPAGPALAAMAQPTVVAFQADEIDPVTGSGWSVTVVGRPELPSESGESTRLTRRLPSLNGPVPGPRPVRITPGLVTGLRFPPSPA